MWGKAEKVTKEQGIVEAFEIQWLIASDLSPLRTYHHSLPTRIP